MYESENASQYTVENLIKKHQRFMELAKDRPDRDRLVREPVLKNMDEIVFKEKVLGIKPKRELTPDPGELEEMEIDIFNIAITLDQLLSAGAVVHEELDNLEREYKRKPEKKGQKPFRMNKEELAKYSEAVTLLKDGVNRMLNFGKTYHGRKEKNRQEGLKLVVNHRNRADDMVSPHSSNTTIYKEIIDDLNAVSHKQFRSDSTWTIRLINARIREGYTVDDFKTIHRNMTDWLDDVKMKKYYRPETLYAKSHFDGYLNAGRGIGPEKGTTSKWDIPEVKKKVAEERKKLYE